MNFNCPTCKMSLLAEAQMAGQLVKCPGCNSKIQIPEMSAEGQWNADGSAPENGMGYGGRPQREVWKEEDPTNPNPVVSVGIGLGLTVAWFAFIYFFQAPPGKSPAQFTTGETLANLFYKHFTVSFANTLFFFWAAAICYLKMLKLKLQRRAMLLDVLPKDLGLVINAQNVGVFIDHVYGLPVKLRDSLMVNRIRKALEFFEVRQNVSEVSSLMGSQSAIDGSRIMGSYILIRAFLWAIPLLGFIGTVVGLSHAISGMSFSNVEDVSKIVESINSVTSGLGTAFDATLLGLIFAVFLNFPLNSLAKHEEEALNDIDAYCNEVLLPRLDDGAAGAAGPKANQATAMEDLGAVAEVVVQALTNAQAQFLTDLNALSSRMLDYANTLEARNEQYQQAALQTLADQMGALDLRALEHMDLIRQKQEEVLERVAGTIAGLEESSRTAYDAMVHGQNAVVSEFTEKLGTLSTELEGAFTASAQITQKAAEGVSDHLEKLVTAAEKYQEATKRAETEALKQFGTQLDTMATEVQKTLSEAVRSIGADSNAVQQATKATQEEALKQFGEKLGSMTKAVETTVASSVQQAGQVIGGLESGIRSLSGVLEQLGTKQVIVQQVKKRGWFSRD
jgi:biopolymer transport protein ExbB/TolQ